MDSKRPRRSEGGSRHWGRGAELKVEVFVEVTVTDCTVFVLFHPTESTAGLNIKELALLTPVQSLSPSIFYCLTCSSFDLEFIRKGCCVI